jgi:hypothetical protein
MQKKGECLLLVLFLIVLIGAVAAIAGVPLNCLDCGFNCNPGFCADAASCANCFIFSCRDPVHGYRDIDCGVHG